MLKIDYEYYNGGSWWNVFAYINADSLASWLCTTMELYSEIKIKKVEYND